MMLNLKQLNLACWSLCLICSAPLWGQDEAAILEAIRSSMSTQYQTYAGVQSLKTIDVQERDPDSGEQLEQKTIKRLVWDYFYDERKSTVESCFVNKKPSDNDDCTDRASKEPIYPIFDANSPTHYQLTLLGKKDGFWKVQVTPLQIDSRHFKGYLFFNDRFQLSKMTGTYAELPFGLKQFDFTYEFQELNNVPVVLRGKYEVRVKVPLVVNKKFVSSFHATNHVLLKKGS